MVDTPEDGSETEGDRSSALLSKHERGLALGLGVASGTAGTVAVFVSENQAGTAALFILAAALLLMGVQGTPLTRFGSGEHSVEFTRRRLGRELIAQARLEPSSERATAYVEAAEIVSPGTQDSPVARTLNYTIDLGDALERVTGEGPFRPTDPSEREITYFMGSGSGRIAIVAKLSASVNEMATALAIAGRSRSDATSILLVTAEATTDQFNDIQQWVMDSGQPRAVETVVWRGPTDDSDLRQALTRVGYSR